MHRTKLIALLLLSFPLFLILLLSGQQENLLHLLKNGWDELHHLYDAMPVMFTLGFCALYLLIVSCFLPLTVPLMLLAGGIYGIVGGAILLSLINAIGASLAFLIARRLFYRRITENYASALAKLNRGIEKDGAFYLILLRLTPIFPSTLVNLLAGITSLRLTTFFWTTLIGSIPLKIIYSSIGQELHKVESTSDIVSPGLMASLMLLVLFLLLGRYYVRRYMLTPPAKAEIS